MATNPATSRHTTDDARKSLYNVWRAYYEGKQPQPRPRPGEVNAVYNYARLLVNKTASYVFPDPVTFQVVDDRGKPEEGNQTEYHLARLYAELDLHEFDLNQEIERSTIGDAVEKVTWDTARNRPRIVSVDPGTITAVWSPDNPKVAVSITQHYMAPAWTLTPYGIFSVDPDKEVMITETWTDTEWSLSVPALVAMKTFPNPYGWIPYLVLPNMPGPRDFWGISDLADVKQPQNDLNRELTTLASIMEMSGAPIAVLENITGTENINVRPGSKWELPEGSKAYLLDMLNGGGVQLHMQYIEQLRNVMNDLAETPRTAFGDTGQQLSGAAMEIEIQPMIQKVKRKRAGWTRHYSERNNRLLDLETRFGQAGAVAPGDDHNTVVIWPPILPSDENENVLNQTQLVGAGIRSRLSANKALGVPDPERELELLRQEQDLETPKPQPQQEAENDTEDLHTPDS